MKYVFKIVHPADNQTEKSVFKISFFLKKKSYDIVSNCCLIRAFIIIFKTTIKEEI